MNSQTVTLVIRDEPNHTTDQSITFNVKATNRNDAFLNATAKAFSLVSGTSYSIKSLVVADPVT